MKNRIVRSQVKKKSSYRSYKPELRVDFRHECCYCRLREPEVGGPKVMQIDHYRPKSRPEFARLTNDYSNLYYCCPECNRKKSNYWPSYLQRVLGQEVIDVCEEELECHISTSGHAWEGTTAKGSVEFQK